MQPNYIPATYDSIYRALVVSNIDATNSGKIVVQCPQVAGLAQIRSAEPLNSENPIPSVGSIVWIAFSGGDVTKPLYLANSSYIRLFPDGSSLVMSSLPSTSAPDPALLLIVGGSDGQKTGSSTAPRVIFRDDNSDSVVDIHASGNIVKTNDIGTAYTWTKLSLAANWATMDTNGVFGGFQYRLDMEDNLATMGAIHMTLAAGLSSGTYTISASNLSGVYVPAQSWSIGVVHTSNANVFKEMAQLRYNNNGSFTLATGAVAQGDNYYMSGTFPLGNIS